MAAVTTELKVLVKAIGEAELKKLENSLSKLGKQANKSDVSLKKVALDLKKVQKAAGPQSINSLRQYKNAWKAISEEVAIGSREFKVATQNAKRLQAQLDKGAQTKSKGRFGGLKGAGQTVGAVAGAGVFGGPEGAIGAGIGAVIGGGPQGALVGGAIGAQVGQARQALGVTAEYAASLQKLRIALFGVTTSQKEYQDALAFVSQTTKDFAIPQDVVTRQFTKLQASVAGAGGNLDDTKVAFNGIVAAVRATGGSLADVDASLTATAQVFSKGKVSAEELRQQIGERLPGAFTLFAESMGKTPQELDKALENGQVSLQDFMVFAEAIFKRYGETAQVIAKAPQSAGDRLEVALGEMNESVGRLLAPIGAAFQEVFTAIANSIVIAADALAKFFTIGDDNVIDRNTVLIEASDKALTKFRQNVKGWQQEINESGDFGGVRQGLIDEQLRTIAEFEKKRGVLQAELDAALQRRDKANISQQAQGTGLPGIVITPATVKPPRGGGGGRTRKQVVDYTKEEFMLRQRINDAFEKQQSYAQAIAKFDLKIYQINRDLADQPLKQLDAFRKAELKLDREILQIDKQRVAEAEKLEQGIHSFNEALAEMMPEAKELVLPFKEIGEAITTGIAGGLEAAIFEAKSLQESLSGILRSVASILLQFGTKSLLGGLFPSQLGQGKKIRSAYGNVFEENKIVPFARGGIVKKPTLFPMANGTGLMGEAGPEAIMPLRRTSSGRLGVEATGGTSNIVVNVDASGTQVQGDDTRGKQLGGAISAAVQAELIKQRRPGGLLAS